MCKMNCVGEQPAGHETLGLIEPQTLRYQRIQMNGEHDERNVRAREGRLCAAFD
jgi:hypothetical protein